jgi:inorganic pyrophosphatase
MRPTDFWAYVDELVGKSTIVIDRPKNTPHPKYPRFIYPLDYGYLDNTTSSDRGGIDLWRGSLPDPAATGLLCTVDLWKREIEFKVLLGCTPEEIAIIQDFFTELNMGHMLIPRPPERELT